MKKKRSHLRRIALLLAIFSVTLCATSVDEVISVTGDIAPGQPFGLVGPALVNPGQAWAVAWVQDSEYWGVTIRANLRDGSFGLAGGIAYLTNSIGFGTSQAANERAVSQTFGADPFVDNWVTLFSDLHLLPDAYYLILAPVLDVAGNSDTQMLWNTTETPVVFTKPGFTRGDLTGTEQFFTNSFDPAYVPGSDFAISDLAADGNLIFEAFAAPEPSTLLLVLTAIPVCIRLRRRRAA